ncbi:hypothetical protein JOS77_28135 [Chromobacterium haemolyticum]|nr:hypothetical protein JOS77_28135 [Chromobacterium haemolyticum]
MTEEQRLALIGQSQRLIDAIRMTQPIMNRLMDKETDPNGGIASFTADDIVDLLNVAGDLTVTSFEVGSALKDLLKKDIDADSP